MSAVVRARTTKGEPTKRVQIRGPFGTATLELAASDFSFLKRCASEELQVKQFEKEFARHNRWGLVKHRFTDDRGGWPVAYAVLTPQGRQALAQEVP